MGKGRLEIRGFALLSGEILFLWATRRQRLGQGWNSEILFSLREEKQEKNSIFLAIVKIALGPTLGSGIPLWFPLTALNSGCKTYHLIIFERVIWVMFLTASFSKCDFKVLPTVSVILTLNLNGDIALLTWFDICQALPLNKNMRCEKWLSWSNRMCVLRGFSEDGAGMHRAIHSLWSQCCSDCICNVTRRLSTATRIEEQVFLWHGLAPSNNLNKCLVITYLVPHTVKGGEIPVSVCVAFPSTRPFHRHLISSTQELCDL